jgi:translation elongation factor EF-1beta
MNSSTDEDPGAQGTLSPGVDVEELEKETRRRLKNIEEAINDGRIVTAAFYIKKLAVYLDKHGVGEHLEQMLKNEP